MKKILLSLALALTVLSGSVAMAVDSPTVTPNNEPKGNKSPKTADVSTIAFAGAGVICLGGAVFCVTKAKND